MTAIRIALITGLLLAAMVIGSIAVKPAHAECLQWGTTLDGTRVCMADDLVNRNPVIPLTTCTGCNCSLLGCGGGSISAAPAPKCEDGWTVVLDAGMQPMCARELRKPR